MTTVSPTQNLTKAQTVDARSKLSDHVVRACRSIGGYLAGLVMTLLIGTLQGYKLFISPLLGSRCRFHPSCSVYAQQSIRRFGPLKGSVLTAARLSRCGPWHAGGIDDVPTHFGFFQRALKTSKTTEIRTSDANLAAHCDCAPQDSFSPSRS